MAPRFQEDESEEFLPAPACITPEDVLEIKTDLREIKSAISGTKLSPDGIVPRLDRVERIIWGVVVSMGGIVLIYIKEKLVGKP